MEQPVEENNILKNVIQAANSRNRLAKGLHQVCKVIEAKDTQGKPKFVVFGKNIDSDDIKKLILALCRQNKVPYIQVEEAETLGEWLGFCKYDQNKNIRKKKKCSVIGVKEFVIETSEEEKKTVQKMWKLQRQV